MSLALDGRTILQELLPKQASVERRLGEVGRQIRRQVLLEGLAWSGATLTLALAASLAADWLLRMSLPIRLALWPLVVGPVLVVVYRHLVRPMRLKLDALDVATLLDRRYAGLSQRAAAVLQLPRLLAGTVQASPSMVRAAVIEHSRQLEQADFRSVLDRRRRSRFAAMLAASLVVPLAFCLLWPGIAWLWAERWLLGSSIRWPQHNYLAVAGLGDDGRILVPRGEPAVLQVTADPQLVATTDGWWVPGRRERLVLPGKTRPQPTPPDQVRIRYRRQHGPTKAGSFTRFGASDFRFELPPLEETTEVRIAGGDDWLSPIWVDPIDRPTLESLTLTAQPPGRSEIQAYNVTDTQQLFLPKTKLELRLASRMPLETASLTAKAGPQPPLEQVDARTYLARWTMTEPMTLELVLVGLQGGLTSKPYYVSLGLLKDREPRVTLRSSGVGRRVTPSVRLPLTIRALDDFGLTSLALEMEHATPTKDKPEVKSRRIDVEGPPPDRPAEPIKQLERQTTVALAGFGPQPGMALRLRGLAGDNNTEGSQTGFSRWLSFQVVKPEELFHELLMRQRVQRAKFAAALATAKSQAATLAGAVTVEQVPGLVRTHQVVARQVWEVANQLDASLEEMTLNDLGTSQARELLQTRVIAPMRDLHHQPMAAMRGTLEAVAADKPNLEARVSTARVSQQEIVQTMQRILEQMAQWESFVDVVNQLREIIKLEGGLLQATEELRKKQMMKLFDN